MRGLRFGNILSVILIVIAASTAAVILLGQIGLNANEYQSEIKYSYSRVNLSYDYSCEENVFGLYLVVTNAGQKTVENLSVYVTNALCVGSVPPLTNTLYPNQSLKFYVYSSAQNGTVTIMGNNTDLLVRF